MKKKPEFENNDQDGLKKRNFIPKRVRKLLRRKEKLSKKVMKSNSWMKNFDTMKELQDVEAKLDLSYQSRRKDKEKDAIRKMNKSSKYFYSYAKQLSKTSNEIGNIITKEGRLVTDPYEKAEVLRNQYESVASQPKSEFIVTNPSDFFDCQDDGYMSQEEEEQIQEKEHFSSMNPDDQEERMHD